MYTSNGPPPGYVKKVKQIDIFNFNMATFPGEGRL